MSRSKLDPKVLGIGSKCRYCGHDPIRVENVDPGLRFRDKPRNTQTPIEEDLFGTNQIMYFNGKEKYWIACPKCNARYTFTRKSDKQNYNLI